MTNHLHNCILRGLHVPYFVILGFRDMDSVAIPLTDRAGILIRRAVRVNSSARNPHNPSWATMPGFRYSSRTFPARYAPRTDPGDSGKGSIPGRFARGFREGSRMMRGRIPAQSGIRRHGSATFDPGRAGRIPVLSHDAGPYRATWTPVARLRHGTEREPSGVREDAPGGFGRMRQPADPARDQADRDGDPGPSRIGSRVREGVRGCARIPT